MKKTTLDLSHILAAYTEQVKAEAKAAEARRAAVAAGAPYHAAERWDISDRD